MLTEIFKRSGQKYKEDLESFSIMNYPKIPGFNQYHHACQPEMN